MKILPDFSETIYNYGLLLLMSWAPFIAGYGQSTKLLRLRPGELVTQTYWRDSIYKFRNFQDSKLIFEHGMSLKYKLNYNMFYDQMDVLNEIGDTVTVKNSPELKIALINGHIFYHDYSKGFIEILVQLPVSLGVKYIFINEARELFASDGYGTSAMSATSTVSLYRSNIGNPLSNTDRLYRKIAQYFFIDSHSNVHTANRANLLRLFHGNREKIKDYIKENNIDFKSEKDLTSLIRYCARFDITP